MKRVALATFAFFQRLPSNRVALERALSKNLAMGGETATGYLEFQVSGPKLGRNWSFQYVGGRPKIAATIKEPKLVLAKLALDRRHCIRLPSSLIVRMPPQVHTGPAETLSLPSIQRFH
jgi:hypothetical protein